MPDDDETTVMRVRCVALWNCLDVDHVALVPLNLDGSAVPRTYWIVDRPQFDRMDVQPRTGQTFTMTIRRTPDSVAVVGIANVVEPQP